MNRITYHPNGYKHEAVAKVKRMLTKIQKQDKDGFFLTQKLTGIEKIDADTVKYAVERKLENVKKAIEYQLKLNCKFIDGKVNEDYEDGFSLESIKNTLDLATKLNEVWEEIKNYPTMEVKTWEYIFNAIDEKEKFEEIKQYLEKNPFDGWLKEYYAVDENRNKKRIISMFFSPTDLKNATSILCEYL